MTRIRSYARFQTVSRFIRPAELPQGCAHVAQGGRIGRIKPQRDLERLEGGLRLLQHHRQTTDPAIDLGTCGIGLERLTARFQGGLELSPVDQDIGTPQQSRSCLFVAAW